MLALVLVLLLKLMPVCILMLLMLATEVVPFIEENALFRILEAVATPAGRTEDAEERPKEDERREESPTGGLRKSF